MSQPIIDMKIVEAIAREQFGMPELAPKRKREGYLAYLGDALQTTCSPAIWPPEDWAEFTSSSVSRPKR